MPIETYRLESLKRNRSAQRAGRAMRRTLATHLGRPVTLAEAEHCGWAALRSHARQLSADAAIGRAVRLILPNNEGHILLGDIQS